jgi:endogenous inhibitor of DNA gyrase (YacG/DUF329 family)
MAQQAGPETCVFCRERPVDARWRPFCSERCKLQDLARWADGTYRIPVETVQDPDAADDSRDGTLKKF